MVAKSLQNSASSVTDENSSMNYKREYNENRHNFQYNEVNSFNRQPTDNNMLSTINSSPQITELTKEIQKLSGLIERNNYLNQNRDINKETMQLLINKFETEIASRIIDKLNNIKSNYQNKIIYYQSIFQKLQKTVFEIQLSTVSRKTASTDTYSLLTGECNSIFHISKFNY